MRRWLEQLQTRVDETVARWLKTLRRFPLFALLLDAFDSFNRDGMSLLAASLSYYTLLSLFPLLLLFVSLATFFISEEGALQAVLEIADNYIPGLERELGEILQQVVAQRGSATIVGVLTLVWASSGVFTVLQYALDRAWRVPQARAIWLQQIYSLGVITVLGILFLVSVVTSVFSGEVTAELFGLLNLPPDAGRVFGTLGGFVFAFLAFVILYKLFPHAPVSWGVALRGALFAAILWQIAKFGYEIYLQFFAQFHLVYGSVGAIIGLLLWGYLSASIVLLGAELSATLSRGMKDEG